MPANVPTKAEFDVALARLTALENRASAIEVKDTTQDARLATSEAKDTAQDTQLTSLTGRVTTTENAVVALDARLDILEAVPVPVPTPPANPTAKLTAQPIATALTLKFSTAGTAAVAPATLATWVMTWGNGAVDQGTGSPPANLAHTYAAAGTYNIELAVTDSKGLMGRFPVTSAITVTPPTPIPVPTPTPTPAPGNRTLLGGWRIRQDFARGAIAIDFSRMKMWMTGHAQTNNVMEYDLPAMGTGSPSSWPIVSPTATHTGWWPAIRGYCNSLCWWQNKLWATTRVFYAIPSNDPLTNTVHPDTVLYAQDGTTVTLAGLPQQQYGGFVKRGPNLDPYIGCGGYESGQGSISGPSLATLAGVSKIVYGWPGSPGAVGANGVPANWNGRVARPPSYYVVRSGTNIIEDSWVGWNPRTINGDLQGRWASDRIWSGGLVLPEGITYWAWLGTGKLDYALQSYTFAPSNLNKTYAYRYDPNTFQLLDYTHRPEFDATGIPELQEAVHGQELGPDGKVYLLHGYQWQSGAYRTDPMLKVFG